MGKVSRKRVRTALFAALFMLAFVFAVAVQTTVRATEAQEASLDGTANASGVEVTTTTDKESYKNGDSAVITISVKNTNTYDLTDVSATYVIPSNFDLTDGERTQTINTLAAGETKEFQLTAKVTEDKNATAVAGGSTFPVVWLIVAVVVVVAAVIACVAVFLKKGKTPPSAGVSALLILAILTGILAQPVSVEAKVTDRVSWFDYQRVSVHDPSIVKDPESGYYYIFGSHRAWAKSKDLISWQNITLNLNSNYSTIFAEPWAYSELGNTGSNDVHLDGQMWAPDVIWNDTMKKWCMYMSIDGNNWMTTICLLTADNIEGPYEYQGIVVYSGMNNEKTHGDPELTDIYDVLGEDADLGAYASTGYSCINAIDPCVKYDENGDLWMSYGSWSAGIYILKLDPATGFRDKNTTYTTERDKSDAYFGTKIAGGYYNSGEASYIIHAGDYYYLFMSYAALEAMGGYQMRIYRSENIDGPYVDQEDKSAICEKGMDMKLTNYGLKIFGSYAMDGMTDVQVAQGHNSALVDDDGKIYLVYHTRFASADGKSEGHSVRVHQMFVNEDGWLVAAPYEYAKEEYSADGYDTSAVVGEYDFLYHEPTQYYTVAAGSQLGIIGYGDTTTKELETAKGVTIGKHQSVVNVKVEFSHEGGEKVIINEDGTVSGDYTGTWEFTDGANVRMNLNGVDYSGIFLQMEDEGYDKNTRMTFTMAGDNICVWGVQTNSYLGITEAENSWDSVDWEE